MAGFLGTQKTAGPKMEALKAILKHPAFLHFGGAAAGAGQGYGVSSAMSEMQGLDDREKLLTKTLATAGGGLTGLVFGHKASQSFNKGIKVEWPSEALKALKTTAATDLGAGFVAKGTFRGGDALSAITKNSNAQAEAAGKAIAPPAAAATAPAPTRRSWQDFLDIKNFPGGAAGLAVTGALTLPAVAALYHFSGAAKRISEGKSVRLSSSLRKRPNQSTDLVLGLQAVTPSSAAQRLTAGETEED